MSIQNPLSGYREEVSIDPLTIGEGGLLRKVGDGSRHADSLLHCLGIETVITKGRDEKRFGERKKK